MSETAASPKILALSWATSYLKCSSPIIKGSLMRKKRPWSEATNIWRLRSLSECRGEFGLRQHMDVRSSGRKWFAESVLETPHGWREWMEVRDFEPNEDSEED